MTYQKDVGLQIELYEFWHIYLDFSTKPILRIEVAVHTEMCGSELKTVKLRLAVLAQKAHYAEEYNQLVKKCLWTQA